MPAFAEPQPHGPTCRAMGFLGRPATLGPIWVKQMSGKTQQTLRPNFDRLLARDFTHLIAARGTLLRDVAKRELERACERTLEPQGTTSPGA